MSDPLAGFRDRERHREGAFVAEGAERIVLPPLRVAAAPVEPSPTPLRPQAPSLASAPALAREQAEARVRAIVELLSVLGATLHASGRPSSALGRVFGGVEGRAAELLAPAMRAAGEEGFVQAIMDGLERRPERARRAALSELLEALAEAAVELASDELPPAELDDFLGKVAGWTRRARV
jgi:hypothetical protein